MSLQQLGKKVSPPVVVNGVLAKSQVTKVDFLKNPPKDFQLECLRAGMGSTKRGD